MSSDAKRTGRPTVMTQKVRDVICDLIAEGMTVREICKGEGMPATSTVYLTLARDTSFSDQYARAKVAQTERMADELLEIADDASNDWMVRNKGEGEESGWSLNGEHVQRSRLRIDSRKWLMSKMAPKKYGEKVEVEHGMTDALGEMLRAVDGKSRGLPNRS